MESGISRDAHGQELGAADHPHAHAHAGRVDRLPDRVRHAQPLDGGGAGQDVRARVLLLVGAGLLRAAGLAAAPPLHLLLPHPAGAGLLPAGAAEPGVRGWGGQRERAAHHRVLQRGRGRRVLQQVRGPGVLGLHPADRVPDAPAPHALPVPVPQPQQAVQLRALLTVRTRPALQSHRRLTRTPPTSPAIYATVSLCALFNYN